MTDKVQREEVEKWVELLRSSVATERLKGAQELASLGVRTRGAVRTRGTISRPAPSRIPEGVDFSAVMEAFEDQHFEVRREVAFALGEWADEAVVTILSEIAETDPEPVVRKEAVNALGKIGGSEAVKTLTKLAKTASNEAVRWQAISALGELVLAEAERLQVERGERPGPVRTRGIRGAISSLPEVSEEAKKVLRLLEEISQEDPSTYVRDLTHDLVEEQESK